MKPFGRFSKQPSVENRPLAAPFTATCRTAPFSNVFHRGFERCSCVGPYGFLCDMDVDAAYDLVSDVASFLLPN